MFKTIKSRLFAAIALTLASAGTLSAAPVTVDLSDASTSVTNAGSALVGIAVLILGIILVIRFLKKG